MERAVAIKKLGKLLGKSLGYRVNDKAPKHDEREAARAGCQSAFAEKERLSKQLEARRNAILAADAEYQEIMTAWKAARDHADRLRSLSMSYKFTVGTSNGLFFHVKAEGDTWEEIIEKLSAEKAAA